MRVTVEDNAPGEILAKLPAIVAKLLEMEREHAHGPDLAKSLGPGEPDPLEEKFARQPAALAMYRRAKATAAAQGARLRADVAATLAQGGA